jgi:SanA protein
MAAPTHLRGALRAAVTGVVLAAAAIGLTNWLVLRASSLDGATRDVDERGDEPDDVALVPGCRVDGLRPSAALVARLAAALELYRAGQVRQILVTGNGRAGEPRAMKAWLVDHAVAERDILLDDAGTRTIESMRNAVANFHVSRAVICTQPLFLGRSLFLAREAGLRARGAAASPVLRKTLRSSTIEALKRTLAFVETAVRARPSEGGVALAAR